MALQQYAILPLLVASVLDVQAPFCERYWHEALLEARAPHYFATALQKLLLARQERLTLLQNLQVQPQQRRLGPEVVLLR